MQATWQWVFISSVLLSVSAPSLQLQRLLAPRFPGSSLLCSYIMLLSEARRASTLLCLSVTNFSHRSWGTALLLGTAHWAPGSLLLQPRSGPCGDWRAFWSRLTRGPGQGWTQAWSGWIRTLSLSHIWHENISLPQPTCPGCVGACACVCVCVCVCFALPSSLTYVVNVCASPRHHQLFVFMSMHASPSVGDGVYFLHF